MKGGGGGGCGYEWRRKQQKQLFLLLVFVVVSSTTLILVSWWSCAASNNTYTSPLAFFFPSLHPHPPAGGQQLNTTTAQSKHVDSSSPVHSYTRSSSSSLAAPPSSPIHHHHHHENTTQDIPHSLDQPNTQASAAAPAVSISNLQIQSSCNFGSAGKWVRDDTRPLYSGFACKQWLSGMWACRLTQRTDFAYEKLRWQPKHNYCPMDDFSGPKFLKRMQDKTLAFIGDSLGRQQFQSLMCMITGGQERQDVQDVGKEYGLVKHRGSVRPDGWAYRFPATNTTILYYWSASLCNLEPLDPKNKSTYIAMHLDRPPAFLQRYISRFSVVVLNTGHHWNRGKLDANRWVMYVGGKPKLADIASAKNLTIHSIVKWVNGELHKYPGLKAFYRSISPRHFFNGDWNSGGTCDSTTPGALEVLKNESTDSVASGAVKGTDVRLLDITALSEVREEGHISQYSIRPTPGMQDCLHWCLPGIPDTWNELLFAQI